MREAVFVNVRNREPIAFPFQAWPVRVIVGVKGSESEYFCKSRKIYEIKTNVRYSLNAKRSLLLNTANTCDFLPLILLTVFLYQATLTNELLSTKSEFIKSISRTYAVTWENNSVMVLSCYYYTASHKYSLCKHLKAVGGIDPHNLQN